MVASGENSGKENPGGSEVPGEIDWHVDSWFVAHHADKLTDEFKTWWLEFYGALEQCGENHDAQDEQDEYWTRCGFAWMGWEAREELK